jgi:polar amino acid transport system substrate-binding protein
MLKLVDFSEPYYFTPGRFAAKRGLAAVEVTPEGLEGKKIAVARRTAHEAYLRAFFRDSSVRSYETVELARDALVTGGVDLLFDDGISLAFWLNGTASKACCEFRGGPFGEAKYFGDGIGIAVSRDDPQLKGMIDSGLRRMRQSGRYEELLLRYFPLRVF